MNIRAAVFYGFDRIDQAAHPAKAGDVVEPVLRIS
jgi:hypothetical protein